MKKTAFGCLSLSFASFVLLSCAKGAGEAPIEHDFDGVFWSISSAEKVVRDRNRERYASLAKEAVIDIKSCQGEIETGQLVATPKKNIGSY